MKKSTFINRTTCLLCAVMMCVALFSACDTTSTEPSPSIEPSPSTEEILDGVLTLYVSTNGTDDADGTKEKPFSSIEAARDTIRTLDKSSLEGINVIIQSGTYKRTSTLEFTAEDSGTQTCPIRYIGEENTILLGGISFDYTEFEKASGDTLSLFPKEVQEKLYMYDMGKLGYTPEDIATMLTSQKYYNEIGIVYVNGKQMDLARYPNADEDWISIGDGYHIDKDGNFVQGDWSNWGNKFATHTVIEYDSEHMDRILSWENTENLFVVARYTFIWCPDDTCVTTLYSDRNEMLVPYSGAYFPREGGIFYFYNIPEELDVPGEYYVDEDAILYYYPEENFETASFTYVTFEGNFITLDNAEYLSFENITFDSARESGIIGNTNHLTIDNCTIRNVYRDGIVLNGANITVTNCEIGYVGKHALRVDGGDFATLTRSNNLLCNNYIHNWSTRGTMNWAIHTEGCGSTVCHNEVGDSVDLGICAEGPYHTIEYNYIYNTNQFFCDGGALNTHGRGYGTVLRYNVISGTGFASDFDVVGVAGIISDNTSGNEIYGNIVYNTTGSSLLAAGVDRDTVFHHNLCIKSGREALVMNCPEYAQYYYDSWGSTPSTVEDYLYSEVWQTAFPILNGIHGNWDPENPDDPTFFYAPVGNKAYSNYVFLDRAYETFPPMYDYKQGHVTDIENHVMTFSGENIESFSEQLCNLTHYNSKRNKNPLTIAQALAIANEACGTIMTPEQLDEVGRIGVDYKIGDILVE